MLKLLPVRQRHSKSYHTLLRVLHWNQREASCRWALAVTMSVTFVTLIRVSCHWTRVGLLDKHFVRWQGAEWSSNDIAHATINVRAIKCTINDFITMHPSLMTMQIVIAWSHTKSLHHHIRCHRLSAMKQNTVLIEIFMSASLSERRKNHTKCKFVSETHGRVWRFFGRWGISRFACSKFFLRTLSSTFGNGVVTARARPSQIRHENSALAEKII